MMNKVKVSKEVADAFVIFKRIGKNQVITEYWLEKRGSFKEKYKSLNDIDFDVFVALMYGSYEVEITVDEQVISVYKSKWYRFRNTTNIKKQWHSNGFIEGMEYMNNMYDLGLDLEGDE